MLPVSYNCKKCPAQQPANVCPTKKSSDAEIKNVAQVELKATKDPLLTVSSVQPKGLQTPETAAALAFNSKKAHFFASKLDDRSIQLSARAKFQALLLVPLLFMNVLSQTPGIGSSNKALAEFVIVNGALKVAPPPALHLS